MKYNGYLPEEITPEIINDFRNKENAKTDTRKRFTAALKKNTENLGKNIRETKEELQKTAASTAVRVASATQAANNAIDYAMRKTGAVSSSVANKVKDQVDNIVNAYDLSTTQANAIIDKALSRLKIKEVK